MDRREFLHASTVMTLAATTAQTASAQQGNKMPRYIDTVTGVIKAWKANDFDGLLAHVTDDIVWHSHVGSPPTLGKPAMREVLLTLAGQMKDTKWRIFHHAQSENRIFLEGADDFVNPEGVHVVLPYLGVMAFQGELISEWRDYFDRNLFNKLKAGEALPEYLQKLVSRPGIP